DVLRALDDIEGYAREAWDCATALAPAMASESFPQSYEATGRAYDEVHSRENLLDQTAWRLDQLVGRIDWSAGRVESWTSYAEMAGGQAANDQLTADKADDPKKASDAEMNVPGENEQSLTDDEEAQTAAIRMIPGGFVYRNRQVNLSGKPRGILSAFVNSRTK